MIKSISICNEASYGGDEPQVMGDLGRCNFLFGGNGTGKTTISRVIADPNSCVECAITWQGQKLQPLVYNVDFVKKNIAEKENLRGIFTLGEASKDAHEEIAALKEKVDDLAGAIEKLHATLDGQDGKKAELDKLKERFEKQVWRLKTSHADDFKVALKGVLNSRSSFAKRLHEEAKTNKEEIRTVDELKNKASTLYGDVPEPRHRVALSFGDDLTELCCDPILQKRIAGSGSSPFAELIGKLQNSDWVEDVSRLLWKMKVA